MSIRARGAKRNTTAAVSTFTSTEDVANSALDVNGLFLDTEEGSNEVGERVEGKQDTTSESNTNVVVPEQEQEKETNESQLSTTTGNNASLEKEKALVDASSSPINEMSSSLVDNAYSPPELIKINFFMSLTTANMTADMENTEFGETIADSTFAFLRRAVFSISSFANGMSMKGRYAHRCLSIMCPADADINANFTFSVAPEKGIPKEEANAIENILDIAFSDVGKFEEWANQVATAGINITSASIQQAGTFVGQYNKVGFTPSTTVAIPPAVTSWAEGVKLVGEKAGTELYVADAFTMQLESERSGEVEVIEILDAKKLVDTTFLHFWDALSVTFEKSFVGLRLRVHTSINTQQTSRNLRSLQAFTSTLATFAPRIRIVAGSDITLEDIHHVLQSALNGTALEEWMLSAEANGVDIVAARVIPSNNRINE